MMRIHHDENKTKPRHDSTRHANQNGIMHQVDVLPTLCKQMTTEENRARSWPRSRKRCHIRARIVRRWWRRQAQLRRRRRRHSIWIDHMPRLRGARDRYPSGQVLNRGQLCWSQLRLRRRWLRRLLGLGQRLPSPSRNDRVTPSGSAARFLVTTAAAAAEGKRHHACPTGHLLLPELPVHGFGCPPGNRHFLRYFGPHFRFEPVLLVSFMPVSRPSGESHETDLSYNRASLFFRSSSHSLRRSR